jgi:hypothetical protein
MKGLAVLSQAVTDSHIDTTFSISIAIAIDYHRQDQE